MPKHSAAPQRNLQGSYVPGLRRWLTTQDLQEMVLAMTPDQTQASLLAILAGFGIVQAISAHATLPKTTPR